MYLKINKQWIQTLEEDLEEGSNRLNFKSKEIDRMHTLNYLAEAFDSSQQPEQQAQAQEQPAAPDAGMPGEAAPGQQPQELLPQEQGLSPDEEQELEFDALKKYIIYNKVRELKDKIEETDLVVTEDYKRVLYFINIILNFFDIFEYDQLVGMVDNVVSRIEKMESNAKKLIKKKK